MRAEAVHQDQRKTAGSALPLRKDLTTHDVHERQAILGEQEGFRSVESHTGPKAAVELQHRHAIQRRRAFRAKIVEIRGHWQARHRCDLAFFLHGSSPPAKFIFAVCAKAIAEPSMVFGYIPAC